MGNIAQGLTFAINPMTSILVTGGAGFIGSHTCKALRSAGFDPITYDNLTRGNPESVKWGGTRSR